MEIPRKIFCQNCSVQLLKIYGKLHLDNPCLQGYEDATLICPECNHKTTFQIINRLQGFTIGVDTEDK